MATLTTERRSGKIAAHNSQHSNVQWYDGKKRFTIHLGGKRYTKKTAERFKDIVEALLFYQRNGITTPEKTVENWLQSAPVELRSKQTKAELLVVEEAKTCQQLWDAFLKFKAAEVRLRWKDVDWAQNRFLVHSPKTERSEKHSHRLVPLFDELRTELDKSGKTTEFVVQSFQGTAWNVYEPFQEISERAGLGRIVCPFRNMRRSRSNDVSRRYGETKESLWIGYTVDVMEKHYRLHLDEDFVTC